MGTEITKNHFQGLLLGDEGISNDTLKAKGAGATDSDYTQAGSYPGTPVPAVDTYMALEASGDQAQDGQLEVVTLRAGHPGPEKAGLGFRDVKGGDTASMIKGQDPYVAITGWNPVSWTAVAPSSNNTLDVLKLQSGKLMLTGITDAADVPKIYVFNPETDVWAAVTNPGIPAETSFLPTSLVQLPSGRVLLFAQSANPVQMDVYRTDAEGQTWTPHAYGALQTNVYSSGYTNKRYCSAYNNGQILLIVWTRNATGPILDMAQYASDDNGGSFQQVDASFYTSTGAGRQVWWPQVTAIPGGGFVVATWEYTGAQYAYHVRKLYSAFQAASAVTGDTITALQGVNLSVGLTTWTDEDQILYILASDLNGAGTERYYRLFHSLDGGETWDLYNYNAWGVPNVTEYLQDFDVASTGGRAILVSRFVAAAGSYDGQSVASIPLGGFSSHTVPLLDEPTSYKTFSTVQYVGHGSRSASILTGLTYIPIATPDAMGWTLSGGAGGTGTLTAAGQFQIDTTPAGAVTRYYYTQYAYDEEELFSEFALQVDSGGSQVTDDCSVRLQLSDGATYGHIIILRFNTAGFAVFDLAAGANVFTQALDMTSMRHIRVAMESPTAHTNAGRVRVWYADDEHIRDWVEAGGSSTVNSDAGASGLRDRMEWGCRAATNTIVCQWEAPVGYEMNSGPASARFTWNERSDGVYASTWANPDDIRPFSAPTAPLLLKNDTKIRAISGPTKIGDSWDIQPGYTYPISAIDSNLNPSPREPWRSTTDAATVDIVWDTETLYNNGYMDNSTLGLALVNCNFKTAVLEGWTGAAWVNIGSINTAEGYAALKFARKGRRIKPDSTQATKGTRYLWFEDHVGDTVDLGASGGEGDNRYHKIAHNTEGAWRGLGVTTKTPTITLATDYLDGAEVATGTMDIWRRDVLLIVHGYVQAYDQFKLRIAAQDTADGHFQIGTLLFGSLAIFGKNHSLGYSTLRSPSVEIVETTGRKRSSRLLGPRRREYELSWTDTIVDNTNVEIDDPNPDYVAGQVGGLPIATPYDTIRVVEGVLDRIEHRKPIVLCRYIPQSTSGGGLTHQILDRRLWMLCRAPNPLNTTAILGTEGVDEAEQLDTVTFIEEV